jgi:hypothetical protein
MRVPFSHSPCKNDGEIVPFSPLWIANSCLACGSPNNFHNSAAIFSAQSSPVFSLAFLNRQRPKYG